MNKKRGNPYPLGATHINGLWNFAVYSSIAESITLAVFTGSSKASIPLDPDINRTGDIWHIAVGIDSEEFEYGFYLQPDDCFLKGIPINPSGLIPDPYAKAFSGLEYWGKTTKQELRSVGFIDDYDWENDRPLKLPDHTSIFYEAHVRGLTSQENSGVNNKGSYKGLTEKIPYLKELGITAIELLPVHEYNENDCNYKSPDGTPLKNYWGYNTIGFFAPKQNFATSGRYKDRFNEFRDMVKAFHQNGIEVILDVVYNHTAESDKNMHVIHLKALDNETYYLLDQKHDYTNYSGCGNTVKCNHPVTRNLILDSLRFWVSEMHVDGFRFDLASILSRNEQGTPDQESILLNEIARDPILADAKLIAEPWDASGMYQVGNFPHYDKWAEWNGKYRDYVRRFLTGEAGITYEVSQHIAGSPHIYQQTGRPASHSINFITAHDGFTMHDLVSYSFKHNEENGENNRDGENQNHTFNYGIEGPTDNPDIIKIRQRQLRNMCAILLLSQGIPMILAGDECGRTQKGNNNTWNQDNKLSWFDWSLIETNKSLLQFWQKMIALRKESSFFNRTQVNLEPGSNQKDSVHISFHGIHPHKPDFSEHSHSLGVLLKTLNETSKPEYLYMAFNFWEDDLVFNLPRPEKGSKWDILMDTYEPEKFLAGERIPVLPEAPAVNVKSYSICLAIHS